MKTKSPRAAKGSAVATLETRAAAVATLGQSAAQLRDAIRAAIAAGDARAPFMIAVRAALGIDSTLSEKDARAASPAFDSVVNAWNYCARKAKGLTGPRAGKGPADGEAEAGEGDAKAKKASPQAGIPFADALASWAASTDPLVIARFLADNMLATRARKLAAELAKLAK